MNGSAFMAGITFSDTFPQKREKHSGAFNGRHSVLQKRRNQGWPPLNITDSDYKLPSIIKQQKYFKEKSVDGQ